MHLCLLFPPYLCPAPFLLSPPPPSLSSALYSLPVHLVNGPHQPDSRYISHISNRSLCASLYLLGDQQPSPCVDLMSSKELLNFPLCPHSVCMPLSLSAVRWYQHLLLLLLLCSLQARVLSCSLPPGDTWYRFLLRSYLRSGLLVSLQWVKIKLGGEPANSNWKKW